MELSTNKIVTENHFAWKLTLLLYHGILLYKLAEKVINSSKMMLTINNKERTKQFHLS